MTLPENFEIKFSGPCVDDFVTLRRKVGWHSSDKETVQISLTNSLFHVAIYSDIQLIAMGRIIGDGAMYFYIQDVVVDPDYQGMGLGAVVMESIEEHLSKTAKKGATIGLLSAKGKEEFYARYAYLQRPSSSLGSGMCKFI